MVQADITFQKWHNLFNWKYDISINLKEAKHNIQNSESEPISEIQNIKLKLDKKLFHRSQACKSETMKLCGKQITNLKYNGIELSTDHYYGTVFILFF